MEMGKGDEKDKHGKEVKQNQVIWVLVRRAYLVITTTLKCNLLWQLQHDFKNSC